MSAKQHKIRVGISMGDYNGIGPEVIIKALRDKSILDLFTPVIFGSGKIFSYQKNIFKINQNYHLIEQASQLKNGEINMINLCKDNLNIDFGTPSTTSTSLAIQSLESATEALIKGEIDILVTAPINKDEMLKQGFSYTGHTSYLEAKFQQKALMFMITEELKVAVSTHHIPVTQVASEITEENIIAQVKTLNHTLREDFCIQKPKIALLGLNPHAGDSGSIGKEEIQIISPAIHKLFNNGILAFGPFPADSFFQPEKYKAYDAVLAMYHDQGLAPFKTIAYEEGVNYSAGLPFIRTSPDHGTAYDIAGKNMADARSFKEAIFWGIKIFQNRKEYQDLLKNKLQPKKTFYNNGIDEDLPEENE
ncbi:4-hydroxythreonine-4-phosphate dehydrogenase PdxA [Elizabethkingia argentiflava]|uniref:4-hydroxythreonine-4-phosphate dehydrogenase PdxA n=1 Tax=Elizabethkingia argenteiflava TaxID=2681556 RepID=A0A845PXQ4_9FLAO|nr:4-hydroxythreonine-4-phosphate dehydrogenase PdxA [Elizabethkingia argenteiflava]NAW51257.1 4-hydroxythreonine-4-phosphate dehydrogenase PdxA [Elizabethkingia argenteiflava]